jgi:glycine hydroxymethyltransferase
VQDDVRFVQDAVDAHHRFFSESLPMIASENLISPLARELLLTDFQDRYAEGNPGERYYQGNQWVDEVEVRTTELAKTLFRCHYADVRPISGTNANMAVLFALCKPGDTISSVALSDGAHISTAKFGAVGLRGVTNETLPWDVENMNIDADAAVMQIRSQKPKVVLIGQSVYLFPSPLKELAGAAAEVGARVWYDAAHVLGLIAGGEFQDPLHEGADLMTGSTHKTLPGPQHGVLLSDRTEEKLLRRLQRCVFPGVVSNHHLHLMAALAVTLAEHIEFGRAYASQIVKNARALGQALHERGVIVFGEHLGFTRSHTLALDVSEAGGGAVGLGSQELTRLGMKEGEMADVAELLARVIRGEDPKQVGTDVREFRKAFQTVHYCFGAGAPAHQRFYMATERSGWDPAGGRSG